MNINHYGIEKYTNIVIRQIDRTSIEIALVILMFIRIQGWFIHDSIFLELIESAFCISSNLNLYILG